MVLELGSCEVGVASVSGCCGWVSEVSGVAKVDGTKIR